MLTNGFAVHVEQRSNRRSRIESSYRGTIEARNTCPSIRHLDTLDGYSGRADMVRMQRSVPGADSNPRLVMLESPGTPRPFRRGKEPELFDSERRKSVMKIRYPSRNSVNILAVSWQYAGSPLDANGQSPDHPGCRSSLFVVTHPRMPDSTSLVDASRKSENIVTFSTNRPASGHEFMAIIVTPLQYLADPPLPRWLRPTPIQSCHQRGYP
ncbi:hypothetical protein NDN01_12110 [Sphingomonas sp. QA11]|uniref:hypothetical protein n=1 Tax=Sphingomonas sp. QA11 TaxID=2950605 RepID=UPI00234A4293|nr:hypothetical protein [Sphingomonas sp. QA11]WCM29575.1 hypothetical protein NDN01_12110 [Sphingomonas sp. QA11]